jgi:hypothetical protein
MTEAVERIFFAEVVPLYSSLLQRCVELINERYDLGIGHREQEIVWVFSAQLCQ